MKRIALITGATSGIGEATARLLAKDYSLIICGRRKNRLEKLKAELSTEIKILSFDVRDKSLVSKSIDTLPVEWQNIDVLINCAGNAHGFGKIQDGDLDDWDAMIDINVKGLLYVSKAILPGMVSRNSGHIINIGSIAGVEVYPNGNVYCASKHAVDAITKGMRMDLNETNIRVCSIDPGLVETEFSEVRFKGDRIRAAKVYEGLKPLTAQDIAETIVFVLSRPTNVNIASMVIFSSAQASSTIVHREPN